MAKITWLLISVFLFVSLIAFGAKPTYDELLEENVKLGELLQKCLLALRESSTMIEGLSNQIVMLKVVNEDQEKQIAKLSKSWIMGGAVSYPIGGELYTGKMFKDFGLLGGAGFVNEKSYLKVGVFFRH